MIGSSEQEAAIPLTLLISNLCVREWKIKATKIQGTPLWVKFLGIQVHGDIEIPIRNWKISCCICLFPQPTKTNKQKNQAKYRVSLFGFWRQYIPHLDMLLWYIYQTKKKTASFQWRQNKKRFYNRSGMLCKLCCLSYVAQQMQR